tara:strand:+ start:146 stop:547 length:402 start_codon:yes stop_codon:yes gene_type:complete
MNQKISLDNINQHNMNQPNINRLTYSDFISVYPEKPIKMVASNDSIASMDTFESSAKSDDSLIEIWERRRISDENHENCIPIRETTKTKRNRETIVDSKSPSIRDALSILQNTEKIISNIGLNIGETSKNIKK